MDANTETRSGGVGWKQPLAGAGLTLALFWLVGIVLFDGFQLDLGSIVWPTPAYARFLGVWSAFGVIAAALLASALSRWASAGGASRLLRFLDALPDSTCIAVGSAAAACVAMLVRTFVLHGARLTDDEAAYRFMAQLLAAGRLHAESPPLKLFFDQVFFVNDGHLYPQYFIGWPALMTPGTWLGSTGWVNAFYSALTVPALYLVLRRIADRRWAKLGLLAFVASPMLAIGAATELAHTSCVAALAWATWFFLRTRDRDAAPWDHAGLALTLSIAFFIRPSAAVGIGTPLAITWLFDQRAVAPAERRIRMVSFAAPALLMAALFLASNAAQTGSWFTSGYQRYDQYMRENGYRFAFHRGGDGPRDYSELLTTDPFEMAANLGAALFRLNFDLFGWPCSLLFAAFAGVSGIAAILWGSLLWFLALHAPYRDVGIDSFGPVHYFETAWPILLLSILGARRLTEQISTGNARRDLLGGVFPAALMIAMVAVSIVGFVPVRMRALAAIARDVNEPTRAVERAGLGRAVVFAPQPFTRGCSSAPNEHFVHWRPPNDPDLSNDLLWANHISVDDDRRLAAYFADRTAYVMRWDPSCRVEFLPLAGLGDRDVADGYVGGNGSR